MEHEQREREVRAKRGKIIRVWHEMEKRMFGPIQNQRSRACAFSKTVDRRCVIAAVVLWSESAVVDACEGGVIVYTQITSIVRYVAKVNAGEVVAVKQHPHLPNAPIHQTRLLRCGSTTLVIWPNSNTCNEDDSSQLTLPSSTFHHTVMSLVQQVLSCIPKNA